MKWQSSVFIVHPYFFNEETFAPSKNEIDACDDSWLCNSFSEHPNNQKQNEHDDDLQARAKSTVLEQTTRQDCGLKFAMIHEIFDD